MWNIGMKPRIYLSMQAQFDNRYMKINNTSNKWTYDHIMVKVPLLLTFKSASSIDVRISKTDLKAHLNTINSVHFDNHEFI